MHYRLVLGCFLVSACAQRYSEPVTIRTSAAPDETFQCVRQQLAALGYKQSTIDVDELRITGTKINMNSRRPDTQFRRMLERLEVDVSPEADGQTSLSVRGHTFAEYTTQRGPTEVEERASEEVRNARQQLIERCRG
ncbi:MAG TPA: hypothetical protein VHH32_02620 [Gemmatimonadales bacterium]|nr:hypothetical protein [Gemmatimonadales bacterium]